MCKVTRATLWLNSWPDVVCQGRHHSKQHCGDRQDGGKDEFAHDATPLSMGRTAPALGRHLAAKAPNRQVALPRAELTAPNPAGSRRSLDGRVLVPRDPTRTFSPLPAGNVSIASWWSSSENRFVIMASERGSGEIAP